MTGRLPRWAAVALLLFLARPCQGAPLDPMALRTIPAIEVIRLSLAWIGIKGIGPGEDDLARIAKLDPKMRTLVWLAALEAGLFDERELRDASPSFFIGWRRYFPRMKDALVDAGMSGRAAAFAAASANASGEDPIRLELGVGFGGKADFDAAIVAYARAEPAVAAWCANARARLSEEDRLRALLDALAGKEASDAELMSWPEPYRVLVLAGVFDSEVGNGGVDQFFSNSSGDLAPETADAMRILGLQRNADALERGMSLFAKPFPKDRERRAKAFDHDGSALEERLAALADAVDDNAVRPAMLTYAKQKDLLPH